MPIRSIVGIIALGGASFWGILGALLNFEMIEKVNEKLPEGERFEWLDWNLNKYQRLKREYGKFYPNGQLLVRVRILTVLLFVWILVSAWGFGLFAR
jgi:hypothetical protein